MTALLLLLTFAHADTPGAASPSPADAPTATDTLPTPVLPQGPSAPGGRIINGVPVEDWHIEAAGGLLVDAELEVPPLFGGPSQTVALRSFVCSSTLIAPDVVLTAAHCVDEAVLAQGGTATSLAFRWSRKVDLTSPAAPGDAWPDDAVVAEAWATPPDWSINAMNDLELGEPKYDIALVFLREEVEGVQPARLIDAAQADAIQPGALVEIVGWGMQVPLTILESLAPPEPGTFGTKHYGASRIGEVGAWEFQVGQDEDHTRKCKGDSGGPTFMNLGTPTAPDVRLIGVTSRSKDYTLCATEGGFDTRVDAYVDWVDAEMRAACEDGRRPACTQPGVTPLEATPDAAGCTQAGGRGGVAGLGAALALLSFRRRR